MSSIPVRKGSNRRSAPSEIIAQGLLAHTTTSPTKLTVRHQPTYSSKENKEPQRPVSRQSSKKELWENNVMLKEEIKALEEKQRHMDAVLSRTKCKLEKVVSDSKTETTSLKETIADLDQKHNHLQQKVESYKKKLLTCQIDPVTLKVLDPQLIEKEDSSEKCQQTKVQTEQLRERFTVNNTRMMDILTNLKGVNTELDEIIADTDSIQT